MSRRATSVAFAVAFGTIYLGIGVPALLLLPRDDFPTWLGLALLHECLALGLAIDLAELLFGLVLRPRAHARLAAVERSATRVAVLYLCCDDVDEESLASLKHLEDVDVFVLDDSRTAAARRQVDRAGLTVVRRGDRAAFKAGNLNHWLERHADDYDYFVVLDSDSVIGSEAIWELVAHAAARENDDVAIVQSSTLPRAGNRFQTYLSIQAPLRNRILRRLYDAIGWTLSHGHNSLHRTSAIRSVGGFDTSATCEDTATSLRLLRNGWRVILVETESYDTEPRDVVAFRRRHVRWARQTIDVIAAMRLDLGWSLTLLMARHALAYALPVAGTLSLALYLLGWTRLELPIGSAQALTDLYLYAFAGSLSTIVLLRVLLCIGTGQRLRALLVSTLLSGTAIAFCCLHTTLGMLRSLAGQRVGFTPTGAAAESALTVPRLLRAMSGAWIAYVAVAAFAIWNLTPGVNALSLFWLTCFVGSPLVLWVLHRDQRSVAEGGGA